jgi:hypothetical protein
LIVSPVVDATAEAPEHSWFIVITKGEYYATLPAILFMHYT